VAQAFRKSAVNTLRTVGMALLFIVNFGVG